MSVLCIKGHIDVNEPMRPCSTVTAISVHRMHTKPTGTCKPVKQTNTVVPAATFSCFPLNVKGDFTSEW